MWARPTQLERGNTANMWAIVTATVAAAGSGNSPDGRFRRRKSNQGGGLVGGGAGWPEIGDNGCGDREYPLPFAGGLW